MLFQKLKPCHPSQKFFQDKSQTSVWTWNLLFKFVQFFLIWKCVRLFLCSFCADMRLPRATVSLFLNVNGIGIVILINPLDHMIPFINQALFAPYTVANFYIYTKLFLLLFSIWYLKCVLEHCTFVFYACTLPEPLITRFQRNFEVVLSSTWYALVWDTARRYHCKLDLYTVASQHGVTVVKWACELCEFQNWQLQNWLRNWKWTHCWIESLIETQFGLFCLQSVPRTLNPADLNQQVVLSFRLSV